MVEKIEPFHRLFSLEDKSIQFPYSEKERVPIWLCGVRINKKLYQKN